MEAPKLARELVLTKTLYKNWFEVDEVISVTFPENDVPMSSQAVENLYMCCFLIRICKMSKSK